MAVGTDHLLSAIQTQAPNLPTEQAMLVGSYGESGWDPYAQGSGGGGAFGFTPPNYPASLETAPPSKQVAAILPAYTQAQQAVPGTLTNPAAAAEYQALAAERPAGYTAELQQISATNAPTQYGANTSYWVQNWSEINKISSGSGANSTPNVGANGNTGTINIRAGNPVPTFGPSWLPWNYPADATNSLWHTIFPFLVILVGILLIVAGMFLTFHGQQKINVNLPSGAGDAPAPKGAEGAEAGSVADDAALAAA